MERSEVSIFVINFSQFLNTFISLKITTKAQFERLVQIMERNPEIARGKPKFGATKNTCKELWEEFAVELNSLGPPTRTSQEWQRVWIHYKASIKKKLANNKRNTQATGGGPSQEIPLNSLEDTVSQLLSLQEKVAPSGQVFGVENTAASTDNSTESVEQTIQPADLPTATPIRRRRSNQVQESERLELLRKQAVTQNEILQTLKKLEKNSYRNYEINKKMLEIKKTKFALWERQANEATDLYNLGVHSLYRACGEPVSVIRNGGIK